MKSDLLMTEYHFGSIGKIGFIDQMVIDEPDFIDIQR